MGARWNKYSKAKETRIIIKLKREQLYWVILEILSKEIIVIQENACKSGKYE